MAPLGGGRDSGAGGRAGLRRTSWSSTRASTSRPRSRARGRSCATSSAGPSGPHRCARSRCSTASSRVGARARIDQPRIPTTVWTVTGLTEGHDFTWEASGPGTRTTGRHARRGDRAGHLPGHPLDHPVGLGRLARRARLPLPHRPLPRPGGRRSQGAGRVRREPRPDDRVAPPSAGLAGDAARSPGARPGSHVARSLRLGRVGRLEHREPVGEPDDRHDLAHLGAEVLPSALCTVQPEWNDASPARIATGSSTARPRSASSRSKCSSDASEMPMSLSGPSTWLP